jgi:polyisoprenyl-phosphate glycosyltransferase
MSTKHSIVIPCFNEELVVDELYRRLVAEVAVPLEAMGDSCELVLVDDGSSDRTLEILSQYYNRDPKRIRIVGLSRNFGHQNALTAGLDFAQGETITVIDADLEDPPRVILEMIKKWREGFDVVYGIRKKRNGVSIFRKLAYLAYYRLLRMVTKIEIPLDAGDFRLMSRRALNAFQTLREKHRFLRGMAKWIGFRQASVEYVRDGRFAGETKYTLRKMFSFAWDGVSSFSDLPLKLAIYCSIITMLLCVVYGFHTLYKYFFLGQEVQGWTSLIVTMLFLSGVQLLNLGIMGNYVGRIFEELKNRPLYLVSTELGFKTKRIEARNSYIESSALPPPPLS